MKQQERLCASWKKSQSWTSTYQIEFGHSLPILNLTGVEEVSASWTGPTIVMTLFKLVLLCDDIELRLFPSLLQCAYPRVATTAVSALIRKWCPSEMRYLTIQARLSVSGKSWSRWQGRTIPFEVTQRCQSRIIRLTSLPRRQLIDYSVNES